MENSSHLKQQDCMTSRQVQDLPIKVQLIVQLLATFRRQLPPMKRSFDDDIFFGFHVLAPAEWQQQLTTSILAFLLHSMVGG
jgi:hypothetical protein